MCGGIAEVKDWDRRGERQGMPPRKENKPSAGARAAGRGNDNEWNGQKELDLRCESVRGRKKIGSNWDRQASGVRAGSGNRWTSRHGIGSVRALGRMDRLQLKLIGRALSLSSVLSVSHVNSVRPDQIRSAPMLLACLLAITVTAPCRPLLPRSRQPDTDKCPSSRSCPTAIGPYWGKEGRGHSQGPQTIEAGTINRWQVTSSSPRRSNRTTGGRCWCQVVVVVQIWPCAWRRN